MCVKLPPGDLNPNPYPSHPTSTYTYGVITAPRMHGGSLFLKYNKNDIVFGKLFAFKYIYIKASVFTKKKKKKGFVKFQIKAQT